MAETEDLAQATLAKLEALHKDKDIPILDELGVAAVRAVFEERNMVMIGGMRGTSDVFMPGDQNRRVWTRYLFVAEIERMLATIPNSLIGPYILDGTYYSNGLGVWVAPEPTVEVPTT